MYVTYSDMIQIGILIVALASLIYQIFRGFKNLPACFISYQESDYYGFLFCRGRCEKTGKTNRT